MSRTMYVVAHIRPRRALRSARLLNDAPVEKSPAQAGAEAQTTVQAKIMIRVCIYIYVCIHTHTYIYIYIYMHVSRIRIKNAHIATSKSFQPAWLP